MKRHFTLIVQVVIAVGTILGGGAAILTYFDGRSSRQLPGTSPRTAIEPVAPAARSPVTERNVEGARSTPVPSLPEVRQLRPKPEPAIAQGGPFEFSVRDGEQQILLAGRGSVAVAFHRFGEIDPVEAATISIYTREQGTVKHLLPDAGQAFDLRDGGRVYSLFVTRLDPVERAVSFRLQPNGDSKGG